jgi:hypothetical protein
MGFDRPWASGEKAKGLMAMVGDFINGLESSESLPGARPF